VTRLAADADATIAEMRRLHQTASAQVGEQRVAFRIAEVDVEFRIAGSTLPPRLTPALEHQPPGDGSQVVVHLWDAREAGTPLPSYPDEAMDGGITGDSRVSEAPDVRVRYQPDLRVLTVYDRRCREAWYCAADATELPWWETGAPMRSLLSWVMADHDRVLVHGAAVGAPDHAVLLVGAGGSGKSSTSLACLEAGVGFLGDDYCVLDTHGSRSVHTLYGTAKVHADQLDLYPKLQAFVLNPVREVDDKVLLLPARRAPDQIVQRARVGAVVAPRIGKGTASRLEPMPRAAALAALAPSSIFQVPGAAHTELSAMADLIRAVPCFRLWLGSDRAGVVEALLPLFEGGPDRVGSR
jgi:hypothetical protein